MSSDRCNAPIGASFYERAEHLLGVFDVLGPENRRRLEFAPLRAGLLAVLRTRVTLATRAITALALEPMGELAGTASSLLSFSGFAFGAALAAVFDALVDQTVTPFVLGFSMYVAIGFVLLCWAGGPEPV